MITPAQTLSNLKKNALQLMSDKGYSIKEDVTLEVDKELSIMGYTTSRDGKTVIIISEWALTADMVMGLLIHELSHIYRIQSDHPSHNFQLHAKVLNNIFEGRMVYSFQEEIVHNAINTIQDLYADDISFEVYIKESQKDTLNEFFLGWVRSPLPVILTEEDKWKSAELFLSTAFAQANLERHKVEDKNQKIEKAITAFLRSYTEIQVKKFEYFKNFMITLPEKIAPFEFEELLTEYISEFLEFIDNTPIEDKG